MDTQVTDISSLFTFFQGLMSAILPILIGLAVIFFIWSLLMFLKESGSKKDEAKSQMIWGIVIIFVMVSVWGLVGILQGSLGEGNAPTDLEGTLLPS
ncbi:MAG: hypothetical protein WCW56_02305 [Candidatus Paceibacterota bacterium]|jgi:heme/copper-type cytochrome/quinol oxidase subunit 4